MNPLAIGLAKSDYEYPVMGLRMSLQKPFVGRYQKRLFLLRHVPQRVVISALARCLANVDDLIPKRTKLNDRPAGNVLVHDDFHG